MNEFTAKVKITPRILALVKKRAFRSKLLTPLLESYWKPKGISLKNFPPGKKVIRLRVFQKHPEKALVEELNTDSRDGSYVHSKTRLFKGSLKECESFLERKRYEEWAAIQLRSTEHKVELPSGLEVDVMEEEINGKKTIIKLEAKSQAVIEEVKKLLNLSSGDLILKNRAELLAEAMDLPARS